MADLRSQLEFDASRDIARQDEVRNNARFIAEYGAIPGTHEWNKMVAEAEDIDRQSREKKDISRRIDELERVVPEEPTEELDRIRKRQREFEGGTPTTYKPETEEEYLDFETKKTKAREAGKKPKEPKEAKETKHEEFKRKRDEKTLGEALDLIELWRKGEKETNEDTGETFVVHEKENRDITEKEIGQAIKTKEILEKKLKGPPVRMKIPQRDRGGKRQIVRTGIHNNRKVVKYSDGTIEYAD